MNRLQGWVLAVAIAVQGCNGGSLPGGEAGGSATAGGSGTAGGTGTAGGATAGGSGTAGGTATAGGTGTAGGTATAGGTGTAGGTATAGGAGGSSGGSAGGTVTCTGGCSMFQPMWTANPMTQPPYGSGASKIRFVDDTTFVTGIGVLSSTGSGSPLFVFDGKLFVYDRSGAPVRQLGSFARSIEALAISADKTRVAAGPFLGGQIQISPIAGGTAQNVSGISSGTYALAFSPDGLSLFSGGSESSPRVRRTELSTGAQVFSMSINAYQVVGIVPNAAGTQIEVGSEGLTTIGTTHSYRTVMRSSDLMQISSFVSPDYVEFRRDPRTGGIFYATASSVMGVVLPGPRLVAAAPHPTLAKAVTLHEGGTLRLVDLTRQRIEDEIRADVRAYDVDLSPDGTLAIVAGIQPVLAAFSLVPGTRPPVIQPPLCGNGQRDPGEACDGTSGSCSALGYTSGSWACRADCTLDRSACVGLLSGWSCTTGNRQDGVCDCGCDAPDPDCGPNATAAACQRSACANGTQPALNSPWMCAIDSCANLSAEGRCNNGVLEGCGTGTAVQRIYCSSYHDSTTQPGTCESRLGAPTCSVPDEQPCIIAAGTFVSVFTCAGPQSACVYAGVAGGKCQTGYARCGSPSPLCLGADKLQAECNGGTPIVYDCLAMGGACANSKCVDLWRGALCDAFATCRAGLTCTNGTCQ